jgi:hypothetical protein
MTTSHLWEVEQLVKVPSKRRRIRSVRQNVLDSPAAIVVVPGPSRIRTPQFPTGPAGIGLKSLMLNMLPVAEFAILPLPTQSGRWNTPR